MFPWIWLWAPTYQFPWSGNWAQRVDTDTVVGALTREGSRDPSIERKAIDVASYGSQLGWITALLLADDAAAKVPPGKVADARQKLHDAYLQIEQVKQQSKAKARQDAEAALKTLRDADPVAYEAVLALSPRPLKGLP